MPKQNRALLYIPHLMRNHKVLDEVNPTYWCMDSCFRRNDEGYVLLLGIITDNHK